MFYFLGLSICRSTLSSLSATTIHNAIHGKMTKRETSLDDDLAVEPPLVFFVANQDTNIGCVTHEVGNMHANH